MHAGYKTFILEGEEGERAANVLAIESCNLASG